MPILVNFSQQSDGDAHARAKSTSTLEKNRENPEKNPSDAATAQRVNRSQHSPVV
jgi:hypothetical protein